MKVSAVTTRTKVTSPCLILDADVAVRGLTESSACASVHPHFAMHDSTRSSPVVFSGTLNDQPRCTLLEPRGMQLLQFLQSSFVAHAWLPSLKPSYPWHGAMTRASLSFVDKLENRYNTFSSNFLTDCRWVMWLARSSLTE